MKASTWLERAAIQFDLLAVIGATIYAFYSYYTLPSPGHAIFWILVAIFFGRGQAARYLATAIREELQRDTE